VACGTAPARIAWAPPQTLSVAPLVDCSSHGRGVGITVRRLELRDRTWRVEAELVNRLGVSMFAYRPHRLPPATWFGLTVFDTPSRNDVQRRAAKLALQPQLVADRFDPPLPARFAPGKTWRGSFSGVGRVPASSYVRVVFNRFQITGTPPRGFPDRFICVSEPARAR
jgi:hypothetical protein